ncbi:sensor histidine kinase [Clostridium beijerinckii]|uniref:sensor histidine kinase n=1 Tax=Clostridium beijerinckii TaxID=1520 RepID=UPI00232EC2F3|nr:ATP-binding protein [Clostridium beijerinckii]
MRNKKKYLKDLKKKNMGKDKEIRILKSIIEEKDKIIQKLKNSDKNFRTSLKDSSFILAHVDEELRYTWLYNPHYDFEQDESIGKRDDELSLNEGTLQLMDLKIRVLETGERQNKEISFPLSNGVLTYNVNGRPLKDDKGKTIGIVTASSDITELKLKEKELKENQEILRSILQSTSDGILVLSNDFKVIHSNECFYEMWDIPEVLRFKNDALMLYEHCRNKLVDSSEFKSKIFFVEDLTRCYADCLKMTDGRIIEFVSSLLVVKGEINGIVCSFRDITDRNKVYDLEKNLLEKKKVIQEAERYNKLKSQIFSTISHELKTPINIILASIQLIESYKDRTPKCKQCCPFHKYSNAMKQNSYRLIRLINNYIDINKIEANFFSLDLKNTNIIKIVEDITLSVVQYARSKEIELIFDTEIEEKVISFDVEKIERVMLNLLSNAIKFTKTGGTINVNISCNESKIKISVEDTGIGIPLCMQSRIFDTFTQVDQLYRRKAEGSGIGLALVKSFVEMHGGKVIVESSYGKGSIFTIELPIKLVKEKYVLENENRLIQSKIEKTMIEFSDIYALSVND